MGVKFVSHFRKSYLSFWVGVQAYPLLRTVYIGLGVVTLRIGRADSDERAPG